MRTFVSRGAVLAASLALASVPAAAQARAGAPADLILTGGKVFTADPAHPWAQAVAVRGERIVAVGTDAQVRRLAGPRTRRLALGGRVVVPGFNDAHDHYNGPSDAISIYIPADPVQGPPLGAVMDSVAAAVRRARPGQWVNVEIGLAVLEDPRARSGELRRMLDAAAPQTPVHLARRGATGTT
jgi:predicted amidohydrolase YtcJ